MKEIPCPTCISYAICVNRSTATCEILDDTFKGSYVSYNILKEIRLTLKKDKIIIENGHFTTYNNSNFHGVYTTGKKEMKW